ncbi:MAG TPA: hypothetical protein VM847_05110 [Tahibacter sp.]|jgi:hypothetical protein|nr:hypothetical protein [Tahibacter sp.]
MLKIALLLFAIGAVGGLVLAASVLRGRIAPWALSAAHAALGASGIVVLLFVVLQGAAAGRIVAALALFVAAALGGFYLASLHWRGTIPPKAIVFVHAVVAVTGFLTLLSAVLGL